jgi:isoleucyl-tRNA synthetase
MPELERYILSRLAALDIELRGCIEQHAYSRYTAAILGFVNQDLSAFFFDVRKDSLYCDAAAAPKRRAYRTCLVILFDAIAKWLAPVLVFTAEEAWEARHGEGSVHVETFSEIPAAWRDEELEMRFARVRELRAIITHAIEPLRRDKIIGSSNEASINIILEDGIDRLSADSVDLAELSIVSEVNVLNRELPANPNYEDLTVGIEAHVAKSVYPRCARCWRHLPDVAPQTALCGRCSEAIAP